MDNEIDDIDINSQEAARLIQDKARLQAADRELLIQKLEIERDAEEDWIRKSSLTAKIINLKNFHFIE